MPRTDSYQADGAYQPFYRESDLIVDTMTDQVTDIAAKLSKGGRLYADARERDGGDTEATPEPKVEQHAPQIPKPWVVSSIQPEAIELEEQKKPRRQRDWSSALATFLQVLGMAVLTVGFGLLAVWLGVVVGGVCLVLTGVALGLPPDWALRRAAARAARRQ